MSALDPDRLILTPQQIREVQQFYDLIWKRRSEVSKLFYERLFEIAPDTRQLFKPSMVEQRRQLMQALGFIVTRLHMPEQVLPSVKRLAVAHVGYGALPHHYGQVGAAMVAALEGCFGDEFTPRLRASWAAAFGELARIMISEAYPPDRRYG